MAVQTLNIKASISAEKFDSAIQPWPDGVSQVGSFYIFTAPDGSASPLQSGDYIVHEGGTQTIWTKSSVERYYTT